MIGSLTAPRLALARPANHPLADTVRKAGWVPVPYPFTQLQPSTLPPPIPLTGASAVVLLSPSGARVAASRLPAGTLCLVQGAGTAQALGREDLDIVLPAEARAEALWDLLQERFPDGGEFILARGERSREYLEESAKGTSWRIHPWITHREAARNPFPPMPRVEGVLALSPLQAEILAPLSRNLMRFAWGEAAARAFEKTGAPAHGRCEPKPSLLWAMLAQHVQTPKTKEESPC
jgi:hypothetical protein